eukprot:5901442-Alexandrium_andersonii.AAC.1
MSASLVGSEMCIRDSFPPFHAPFPPCHALFPPGHAPRTSWRSRARHQSCLLYTSDAADDM